MLSCVFGANRVTVISTQQDVGKQQQKVAHSTGDEGHKICETFAHTHTHK